MTTLAATRGMLTALLSSRVCTPAILSPRACGHPRRERKGQCCFQYQHQARTINSRGRRLGKGACRLFNTDNCDLHSCVDSQSTSRMPLDNAAMLILTTVNTRQDTPPPHPHRAMPHPGSPLNASNNSNSSWSSADFCPGGVSFLSCCYPS